MHSSAIGFLIVLLSLSSAAAHDFWIEPSTFCPEAGQTVRVALRVGDHFQGEPVARIPTLIEKFIFVGPGGEQPLPGFDGRDPAGLLKLDSPGLYVLGYRSKWSSVKLEAAKFENYLKEEGLERISALRVQKGESDKPASEVFSRCAKSLVLVGPANTAGFDRPLGFTLELIPESNPYLLKSGEEMVVRLLFNSQPLEGTMIRAMHRDAGDQPLSMRSDANGRAAFKLDKPGFWMIKAVHLQAAPLDVDADYESLWASLTFEVGGEEGFEGYRGKGAQGGSGVAVSPETGF